MLVLNVDCFKVSGSNVFFSLMFNNFRFVNGMSAPVTISIPGEDPFTVESSYYSNYSQITYGK